MKTEPRQILITYTFMPHARITDRRAQWHRKHLSRLLEGQTPPDTSNRPLWPLALTALVIWAAIAWATWFLIHTWSA